MARNETQTRAQLIDPALRRNGWAEDLIRREETAGAIEIIGGQPRQSAKRADYTLRLPQTDGQTPTVTVAVVEAKPEDYTPHFGLQQAKEYARRLNVPFAYSSNGRQFVEYEAATGETKGPLPMKEFPRVEDIKARYEKAKGFKLDSDAAKPLLQPYRRGDSSRRYYQDAAIRAVLEKIAAGGNRALVSMATGSGKTHLATQLLAKIADAGQLKRALFVCDRDQLRAQAHAALQGVFGNDAAMAVSGDPAKNARIVIATYQTLGVATEADDEAFLTRHYPPNYFSHIIIDEAHRSAWNKWSLVLTRNPEAIQVGLTATPREFEYTERTADAEADQQITADNIKYFGEPVYEYTIVQGIEDGYLAQLTIERRDVFLENYVEVEEVTGLPQADLEGKEITDAITGEVRMAAEARERYESSVFEKRLVLPDRVAAMCGDLFGQLVATGGPEQKTVIFCASDHHADLVTNEMNNLHARWRVANGASPMPDYAFKCTANAYENYLPEFKDNSTRCFVASTVDLLSTGVDVPGIRNVVFFKYVKSPIAFYQMVGRGTRLASEKLVCRVYDYTNATRLFGQSFKQRIAPKEDAKPSTSGNERNARPEQTHPILVEGVTVHISDAGAFVLTRGDDGIERPVPLKEYTQRLTARLLEDIPALDDFRATWVDRARRNEMLARLPDEGRSVAALRRLTLGDDYDLYDVLAKSAYGMEPKTRRNRAEAFVRKNGAWFATMPKQTSAVIKAIASQFALGGTEELENQAIFDTPEVRQAGGFAALTTHPDPAEAIRQTKRKMFEA